jgi:hypothetical protein
MNQADINHVQAMLDLLLHIAEKELGHLMLDMTIYRHGNPSKYSHYLDFVVTQTQWTIPDTLKTVGVRLYMGRDNTCARTLIYKIRPIDYSPSPEFIPAKPYEQMYKDVHAEFDFWWSDTKHILKTPDYVAKKVDIFKMELIEKTMHRDFLNAVAALQTEMVA